MGERAAGFAWAGRHIDPRFVKEAFADFREFRRERAVRVQHSLLRFRPRDFAVVIAGQRRVAVPMLQFRQAQPLRLHAVIAMRQSREIADHRFNEGGYHLVFDHVAAIAGARRCRIVAPGIDDFLVLGQGIGNQREQFLILGERLADRVPGRLAGGAIRIGQFVEHG